MSGSCTNRIPLTLASGVLSDRRRSSKNMSFRSGSSSSLTFSMKRHSAWINSSDFHAGDFFDGRADVPCGAHGNVNAAPGQRSLGIERGKLETPETFMVEYFQTMTFFCAVAALVGKIATLLMLFELDSLVHSGSFSSRPVPHWHKVLFRHCRPGNGRSTCRIPRRSIPARNGGND